MLEHGGRLRAAAQQYGLAESAAIGEFGKVQLDPLDAVQCTLGRQRGQVGVIGDF